jgi:integrase
VLTAWVSTFVGPNSVSKSLRLGAAGHGESIKAVSEYLGHHDPGFTLRTYTHLMPPSGTRARAAVDRVFTEEEPTDDGPDTAQEGA